MKRCSGGTSVADVGRWVICFMIVVIGVYGLFMASRAHEETTYSIGIALFIASVVFVFLQIKRAHEENRH